MNWSQEKVAKIADILRIEYMSTEESEMDEERVKHYKVRKPSWESRKLRLVKKKLDKNHVDSLPGLSKRVMIPRQQGEPSTKPKPANCPDWACIVPTNPADAAAGPGDDNAAAVDLNVSR
jgi:hypothetical protein